MSSDLQWHVECEECESYESPGMLEDPSMAHLSCWQVTVNPQIPNVKQIVVSLTNTGS